MQNLYELILKRNKAPKSSRFVRVLRTTGALDDVLMQSLEMQQKINIASTGGAYIFLETLYCKSTRKHLYSNKIIQ